MQVGLNQVRPHLIRGRKRRHGPDDALDDPTRASSAVETEGYLLHFGCIGEANQIQPRFRYRHRGH
jgi:hypothetical protein